MPEWAKYNRARYDRLKQAGLCVRCGVKRTDGSVLCEECKAKRKAIRDERVKNSVCVRCGAPATQGTRMCFACRLKISETRYDRLRKEIK